MATTLHEDSGLPRAPIVVSTQLDEAAKNTLQEVSLEAPDEIYLGDDDSTAPGSSPDWGDRS